MGFLCIERVINVPLEKVWPIAGDFTKSPDPKLPIKIVNKGDSTKMGVGCERKIQSGKTIFHERLTSIDPPNSYSYEMLSGSPVKYQRGKVEFKSVGDSTHVKWSVEFSPKYPGTGWLFRLVTRKFYNKFIDEMERIK
jgi:hypothetical protein